MNAFIDTSSIFKKYIQEQGSDQLELLLEKVTQITVAPTLLLEMNCGIQRRLHEQIITSKQAELLKHEIKIDYVFYARVIWDDNLEEKALNIINKYKLKTLDSIQLASASLSKADLFVTSDQKLYQIAKKELKNTLFI